LVCFLCGLLTRQFPELAFVGFGLATLKTGGHASSRARLEISLRASITPLKRVTEGFARSGVGLS
jgi:hypothetical protein